MLRLQKKNIWTVILFLFGLATVFYTNNPNETSITIYPTFKAEKFEWLNFTYNQYVHLNYRKQFDDLLVKSCNPSDLFTNYICLNEMYKFDEKFKIADWRLDCTHDERRRILFHTYWQLDDSVGLDGVEFRMLRLNIMSFLATQNSTCSTLIFWMSSDFPESFRVKILQIFAYYVRNGRLQLRSFNFDDLCFEASSHRTYFARSHICTSKLFIHRIQFAFYKFSYSVIDFSDMARFIILDIYGGKPV